MSKGAISIQLGRDVADVAQRLAQELSELDELHDIVIQLHVPLAICGERWVLPEDTRRVRRKHQDELFDLPVLLHLSPKRIHLELAKEDGHCSSKELVRITSSSLLAREEEEATGGVGEGGEGGVTWQESTHTESFPMAIFSNLFSNTLRSSSGNLTSCSHHER